MVEAQHDQMASGRRRTILKLLAGLVVLVVVAGLGLGWWLGYFDEPPEEASLQASVDAISDAPPTDATTAQTSDSDAAEGEASTAADGPTGLDGTWTVSTGGDATFVGYRINEVLTTIGDFEVVGRTDQVTGEVEITGTTIVATELIVDMTSLTTDNDRRDAAMREQALETDRFPTATFVLVEPMALGVVPDPTIPLSVDAVGDLTVHGVTTRVVFPLEAQIVGETIVVVGRLDIELSDFDIEAPQAPIVASVDERAVLELSVALTRGGS